jgi:hypothetical protein
MKTKPHPVTLALLGSVALLLSITTALAAEKNAAREVYFGQTHSHTSWSIDAYLIGNHLAGPEEAYKYSLGMPVKHPMGFEVQL